MTYLFPEQLEAHLWFSGQQADLVAERWRAPGAPKSYWRLHLARVAAFSWHYKVQTIWHASQKVWDTVNLTNLGMKVGTCFGKSRCSTTRNVLLAGDLAFSVARRIMLCNSASQRVTESRKECNSLCIKAYITEVPLRDSFDDSLKGRPGLKLICPR